MHSVLVQFHNWWPFPAFAEIPDEDKFLHVITVHMDAHEQMVRDNQVRQLRAHLAGHVSTDDFVVVGGFTTHQLGEWVSAVSNKHRIIGNLMLF